MNELQAVTLGVLQGVGEFLPISSSAHLALAPHVFGWKDQGLAYDVMLHMGTLLAIAVYFAKDWTRIIKAGVTRPKAPEGRLLWLLAAGSVPAAALGLLFNDLAEQVFRDPRWIACNLIFFSALIYWADRAPSQKKTIADLGLKDIILIGLAQSIALMPGASRAGMTIMAALFLGYARLDAARLSFLLATPVILGAGLLSVRKISPADIDPAFITGLAAAFIAGMISIKFLLSYLKNNDLKPFIAYRIILGAVILWKVGLI